MNDDDDDIVVPGLSPKRKKSGGGPSLGTVVFLSVFSAALTVPITLLGLHRTGLLASLLPAPPTGSVSPSAAPAAVTEHALPDFTRIPEANARSFGSALHLQISVRERRADAVLPAGTVLSQSPPAGTHVREGSSVELVLSSGPAAPTPAAVVPSPAVPVVPSVAPTAAIDAGSTDGSSVEMPRVVGRRRERAEAALSALGLRIGSRRVIFDEDHGPHVVLRQSIEPGTRVAAGTAVDLVINQGE